MDIKKNFCISLCINVLVFGVFLLLLRQLDVFTQLLFSIIPIVVSLIVIVLINRDVDNELNNYFQCAFICAFFNLIYLIMEFVCISMTRSVNDIYEVSQKYNSGYVTVSENNSPLMSIAVFGCISFALHYFAMKKIGEREQRRKQ